MTSLLQVLGFAGSLRRGSYNAALLRAAGELLPEGMTLEIADLSSIPLYNEDVRDQGYPEAVQALRDHIVGADALLIATPEYNGSISGVLKNALDWASRAPGLPLKEKPVAIMGASTGNMGSVRAQMHLRHLCSYMNMFPLNKPEVLVAQAQDKFDVDGRLIDEVTRGFLSDLLIALADWTRRVKKAE
ncbi:MAG: NAD(P)H-dependent oxidoreductase [Anaerolineae bacterium]|nr:NAD(P)H-dependent oxidoreductase [Anaerolineae bacterium]